MMSESFIRGSETTQSKISKTTVFTRCQLCGIILVACMAGMMVGGCIAHFISLSIWRLQEPCIGPGVSRKITEDADESISGKMFERISAMNIQKNLRAYTAFPHLAGTNGSYKLADMIYQTWLSQQLDVVTTTKYNVLLSYPNKTDPNLVQLKSKNGTVLHTSQITDIPESPDVVPPFLAYSAQGDVTGEFVYVHYGQESDFKKITEEYQINLTGKIVIARYGQIYRGTIVYLAEKYGAAGAILYSDPKDFHPNLSDPVYPDSAWMPDTAVERGTLIRIYGDPSTPDYPSTNSSYRYTENIHGMPKIPAHPISARDAYCILQALGGPVAPDDWQGTLNLTYRIGPSSNHLVRLRVATYNQRVDVVNVFGIIIGSVEPDRYILLGNHRDAWTYGGVDPTSGTAVMMELSRVLMSLVQEGWRPRRSIVFCSWDAEEYCLVGSTEWAEEFAVLLSSRAVAYLNLDYSVDETVSLTADSMSMIRKVLFDAAKKISIPDKPGTSVYDVWVKETPDSNRNGLPKVGTLGDRSDHAAFMELLGISSYDVWYTDPQRMSYPLYHTALDTFNAVNDFIDPDLKYSKVLGQLWGETARNLADSLLLPLSATDFAADIISYVNDLKIGYGEFLSNKTISLDDLELAAKKFSDAATIFHHRLGDINKKHPLEVRMVNDQLMLTERVFINNRYLPLRTQNKNVIFAPSLIDSYSGSTFPGLVDLLEDIKTTGSTTEKWEAVKEHLSVIIFHIYSAVSVLSDSTSFMN